VWPQRPVETDRRRGRARGHRARTAVVQRGSTEHRALSGESEVRPSSRTRRSRRTWATGVPC